MEAAGTKVQGLPGPQSKFTVSVSLAETLYQSETWKDWECGPLEFCLIRARTLSSFPSTKTKYTPPRVEAYGEYTAERRQGILLTVFSDLINNYTNEVCLVTASCSSALGITPC